MFNFERITSVRELKQSYRTLVKKCHPDMGGNEEIMKELNKAYAQRLIELRECGQKRTMISCSKRSQTQSKSHPRHQNGFLREMLGLTIKKKELGGVPLKTNKGVQKDMYRDTSIYKMYKPIQVICK